MEDHILGVPNVPATDKDATKACTNTDGQVSMEQPHLAPGDGAKPQSPAQDTASPPTDKLESHNPDVTETAESLKVSTKRQSSDGVPGATASGSRGIEEEYKTDSEDEYQVGRDLAYDTHERLPHYHSTNLDKRRGKGKKRSLQASQYLVLVEDRLKELEYEVKRLLTAQNLKPEPLVVGNPPPSMFSGEFLLSPALLGWEAFSWAPHVRRSKPQASIDLLMEEPYSLITGQDRSRTSDFTRRQADRAVERIRFNSFELSRLFEDIIGGDLPPNQVIFANHLRPFKAIVPYADEVRTKLSDFEEQLANRATEKAPVELADVTLLPTPTPSTDPSKEAGPENAVSVEERHIPEMITIDLEVERRDHVKALVECLEARFSVEIDSYRRLRSRQQLTDEINDPMKVSFAEMWYLFAPGDLVCDCTSAQALRIVSVRGGNRYLVDEVAPRPPRGYNVVSESAGPQRLRATDVFADFVLTCFYIDFDGHNFGPVQTDIHVEPSEGIISIDSLPVIPIEYVDRVLFHGERRGRQAPDAEQSLQMDLLDRGRLFVDLARPGEAGTCRVLNTVERILR
jgi:hypothetical protein